MQKVENRRCEMHPAKSKGVHEHPFSYTKHSLIDRTCEGPYLTPPRRSLSLAGPSTVLAGSLLLNTQWRRSQLCIHTTGTLEPCLVLAMIGAPSSSVTERGSVDAEDTDLFIIIRKKRPFLVRDWGLRRRSSRPVLSPEHWYGASGSRHGTPLRCCSY